MDKIRDRALLEDSDSSEIWIRNGSHWEMRWSSDVAWDGSFEPISVEDFPDYVRIFRRSSRKNAA